MSEEAEDLAKTLIFTVNVIVQAGAEERRKIAAAYHEAQHLAATIEPEKGSLRPKIVACLGRFEPLKQTGDVRAAGWMLCALQLRIGERQLPDWENLQIVADKGASFLPAPAQSLN